MAQSGKFEFNPHDPSFNPDPFPSLAELRDKAPVYFWEIGNMWFLSDYDDCCEVMKDQERYSVNFLDWEGAPEIPDSEFLRLQRNGLFGLPNADHRRVRKLAAPTFSPNAIERRRPAIRKLVEDLLDDLGDAPASFDVVADVSAKLPIRVVSEILGIPKEHEAVFKNFAATILRSANPAVLFSDFMKINEEMPEGLELLKELIEQRRGGDGDDLMSELVRAEEDGERLSMDEMQGMITQLISAGSESTINLIGYGVLNLLRHPEQFAKLKADWSLIEGAVWEVLRYDQFARMGLPRYAKEDLEIRGTKIRKGQMVVPLVIGVLRDPIKFPNANTFDITREQTLNIAFGHGAHYCIGASLARVEGEEALLGIFERWPNLSLDGDPVYAPHPLMRYLQSLPVKTNA